MREARAKNPVEGQKDKLKISARVAVITLSSSRTADDDLSGDTIQRLVETAGHSVVVRKLITDSRNVLRATMRELARQKDLHVIITNGGTGLAASGHHGGDRPRHAGEGDRRIRLPLCRARNTARFLIPA